MKTCVAVAKIRIVETTDCTKLARSPFIEVATPKLRNRHSWPVEL
jgi:hypothetical protein